jgi:hypothetical protein
MATSTTSSTTTTAKPRIRVLGPGRYLMESTSRPGLGHQVDVLRLKCGCEAGKYGSTPSSHTRSSRPRSRQRKSKTVVDSAQDSATPPRSSRGRSVGQPPVWPLRWPTGAVIS